MVGRVADRILYEIYSNQAKKPQVFFSQRKISRFTSEDLFVYRNQDEDMTLMSAEKVLEHY